MEHRLANFIRNNIEELMQVWEDFARTIEPPALAMDDEALRDHAREMLLVFAADLDTDQSEQERSAKSMGLGKRERADTAAEIHAEARLLAGYTAVQLVSEYRALRSSVLALWSRDAGNDQTLNLADMTRFNEAVDQALAESVARYQELVKRSQNMFLAILGHDLRNPLGTMVTGSSFIMQAADVPPKYILVATRMFSSAKRMSKLINDLIDFTRTHLGPGIPVWSHHGNLAEVCTQVVDELRTFHPERRIDLHAPLQFDAVFDDARIAQVVSNLIGNAIQYGDPLTPVAVRLGGSDDEIVMTIRNQGALIPPDRIAAIFDPLVRIAGNVQVRDEGQDNYMERTSLGIGLFVSREIIHAHGGNIIVTSTEEDGTTFTVTLPRRRNGLRITDRPAMASYLPASAMAAS
jgi:signal transduction histidine kinase